jgi:phage regulator Rha-like protein
MNDRTKIIPLERIQDRILLIHGHKVMIDADIAELYGVTTKRLNEQVKRNRERFPEDFMFQLDREEKAEVVANCDHLSRLRFSATLPFVFTEHGAIMVANVLNSKRAVEMSVYVVRAFIKLREILTTHKDLANKLQRLEKKYDNQFKVVFDALRDLMAPPKSELRKIGFKPKG